MRVLTIGFTKKPAQRFFGLLRESGARRVVDVRLNTGSQLAGFAKKQDLAWFLEEICGIEYVHAPTLAPTKELLDDYRKKRIDWSAYEDRFVGLMRERRIEDTVSREIVDGGCLLCSEDQPHRCHRRLVAEYLTACWDNLEVEHLGMSGSDAGQPQSGQPLSEQRSSGKAAPPAGVVLPRRLGVDLNGPCD